MNIFNLSEKKKHGDPMVSLEKMIVYILTDVGVQFKQFVNFEKEIMSVFLRYWIFNLLFLSAHICNLYIFQ